jgi:hypothetical protein
MTIPVDLVRVFAFHVAFSFSDIVLYPATKYDPRPVHITIPVMRNIKPNAEKGIMKVKSGILYSPLHTLMLIAS